jgi:integrase
MADNKENRNAEGKLISFRIRVGDGYGIDGKQRRKTMTWKVPHGMTEKQAKKAVQNRLGHADIATTQKYLHVVQEADEQAVNILQEMFITHKKRADEQSVEELSEDVI